MMLTIKTVAEEFIENVKKNKYFSINKSAVANLIFGNNKYSFLSQDGLDVNMDITEKDIASNIAIAIKASIQAYTRSKNTAISVYSELLAFISKKYSIKISMDLPDWLPTTSLERQLQIVKLLHEPEIKVSDLPDKLLVSDKTIETDLIKLKGDDDDPIEVMGQKLLVEFTRGRGRLSFASTVHPLFLTFNLTQVITTLEGLKKMSDDGAHRNYAINAAKTIWTQLSDYAKQRIFTVSEGLSLNASWYRSLNAKSGNIFYTEMMCSDINGCESVLYCYKNGKPCYIDYMNDAGKNIYYRNCLILSYDNENIMIELEGEKISLKSCQVVKAALTINELY